MSTLATITGRAIGPTGAGLASPLIFQLTPGIVVEQDSALVFPYKVTTTPALDGTFSQTLAAGTYITRVHGLANTLLLAVPAVEATYDWLTLLVDVVTPATPVGPSVQVYQYSVDPTTELILPVKQEQPAICYQMNGNGPLFTWNITTHLWQ